MKKIHYNLIIYIFFLLTPFVHVFAAEMFFESVPTSARVGEVVSVALFLNPEQEINALDGEIIYSEHLKVSHILYGDSLIPLWIKTPKENDGVISYAGIIPGGYNGDFSPNWKGSRPGKVFTIIFDVISEGNSWVQINRDSVVLLNDGIGTEAPLTLKDLSLDITGKSILNEIDNFEFNDSIPPENFTIKVIKEPKEIFKGEYYLIFNAIDKQSGVSYYKVQEDNNPFVIATSPYKIKNQKSISTIRVTAFDQAGNERTEKLDLNIKYFWTTAVLIKLLVTIIIVIGMVLFMIKKYKHEIT